jgi:hypothetical protein
VGPWPIAHAIKLPSSLKCTHTLIMRHSMTLRSRQRWAKGPPYNWGGLNAMKAVCIALEKILWLVVAGIPLMPPYVLYEFHSSLACSDNGICFRYGSPFLNSDGLIIVYFSIALLWPMCIWELIGKHIFFRRLRQRRSTKLRASRFATLFGRLYWLMVGVIPLLFWYLFGTSYSPADCDGNGSCIEFYLPLDAVSKVAVLISCCLLWPVCVRKLIGSK